MTRESKLALIVGFGLILFVGILVSDHFSAGQRQEAAHLLAQRGAVRSGTPDISIKPLVGDGAAHTRTVSNEQALQENIAGLGTPPPKIIGPEPTPGDRSDRRTVRNDPEPDRERSGMGGSGTPEPPPFELYPVKEGETLYSICVAQYGDGTLWPELAEFNKSAVPNPARMREGVTLRVPSLDVLKPGRAERGASTPNAPGRQSIDGPMARGPDTVPPPAAKGTTTYTVQRGETLGAIARKTLGSTSRWKELATLNEDVLPDPNALTPGTVLRVPQRG